MSDVLQLVNFRLVRLRIDSDLGVVLPANPDFHQETGYDVMVNKEDPDSFLMVLRVSGFLSSPGASEDAGTKLEVQAAGEFRVPQGLDAARKDYLVRLNGGMILYGMVRGQVAMATGAFLCGSLLLPSLDWQATVNEIEARRSAQDSTNTGSMKAPPKAERVNPPKPRKSAPRTKRRA